LLESSIIAARRQKAYTGAARLQFHPSPIHELGDLAPMRVGSGHRFSMGLSISTLSVLADLRK
jgi:hypothetical protein